MRSADNSWDFWSLLPEALLQVTIVLFIGKLRARNRVSPDKMLQGRLFSYGDTQCYRLRVNFNHIPVNAPKCPFLSCHRDGAMSTDANLGGTPTYWPNSKGVWTDRDVSLIEPPLPIEGTGHIFAQRIADLTDRLMRRIG